jgi:hypothetical protein
MGTAAVMALGVVFAVKQGGLYHEAGRLTLRTPFRTDSFGLDEVSYIADSKTTLLGYKSQALVIVLRDSKPVLAPWIAWSDTLPMFMNGEDSLGRRRARATADRFNRHLGLV